MALGVFRLPKGFNIDQTNKDLPQFKCSLKFGAAGNDPQLHTRRLQDRFPEDYAQ